MPSEYEAFVAALKLTSTPVAEYGWKTRPEGAYYVVQLDFESGSMSADGVKQDRSWEGSLDLYYPKLTDGDELIEQTEELLTEFFGVSWSLNSTQYEQPTGLFHMEWVFEAMNDAEDPEEEAVIPDAVPDEG